MRQWSFGVLLKFDIKTLEPKLLWNIKRLSTSTLIYSTYPLWWQNKIVRLRKTNLMFIIQEFLITSNIKMDKSCLIWRFCYHRFWTIQNRLISEITGWFDKEQLIPLITNLVATHRQNWTFWLLPTFLTQFQYKVSMLLYYDSLSLHTRNMKQMILKSEK